MNKWIKYIVSGMLIGFANVVPGVSGGTVAVTLGIYRRIIDSLSIKAIVTSFRRTIPFFIALALGVGVGILVLARIMEAVLNRFPIVGVSFFIGLIIGGLPHIARSYRQYRFRFYDVIIFLCGVVVVVAPKILNIWASDVIASGIDEVSTPLLILSGFVASVAMVLPGLSGSLVLLVLGSYSYVLSAINNFDIPVLIIFGLSVVVGIFSCAKLMRLIFKKMPRQTWALILGLVIGSIIFLWPALPSGIGRILLTIAAFVIGLAPSYMLSSAKST